MLRLLFCCIISAMVCATKAKKEKHGKRSNAASELKRPIAIHALQEIFQEPTLNAAISSLWQLSVRTTVGVGMSVSFTCSADGVTARGKGWQLSIEPILYSTTEKQRLESLKKAIEELIPSRTGKRSSKRR